jgi:hypothetical protein
VTKLSVQTNTVENKEDDENMDSHNVQETDTDNTPAINAQTTNLTTNTLHDCHVLPDYGGDIFQHETSKLRQLDLRDLDNSLIPPQQWYSKFNKGALVLVNATLHTFNIDEQNRRVRNSYISLVILYELI